MDIPTLALPYATSYVVWCVHGVRELSACSPSAPVSGLHVLVRTLSPVQRSCGQHAGLNLCVRSVSLPTACQPLLLALVTAFATLSCQMSVTALVVQTSKVVPNSAQLAAPTLIGSTDVGERRSGLPSAG